MIVFLTMAPPTKTGPGKYIRRLSSRLSINSTFKIHPGHSQTDFLDQLAAF